MGARSEFVRSFGMNPQRRTFTASAWGRIESLIWIAIFVGVPAVVLGQLVRGGPSRDPLPPLLLILMLIAGGSFNIAIAFRRFTFLTLSDEGLRRHFRRLEFKRLAWADLTKVLLERPVKGVTALSIYGGPKTLMRIVNDIDGFEVIKVVISEQAKRHGFALYRDGDLVDRL